jgi:hypothetical protein
MSLIFNEYGLPQPTSIIVKQFPVSSIMKMFIQRNVGFKMSAFDPCVSNNVELMVSLNKNLCKFVKKFQLPSLKTETHY